MSKWRLFCLQVPCSRIPSPICTSKIPFHTEYISGFISYSNETWNTYLWLICLEEAQRNCKNDVWRWCRVLELAKISWVSDKESTTIAVLFIVSINPPCAALSNVKGNLTERKTSIDITGKYLKMSSNGEQMQYYCLRNMPSFRRVIILFLSGKATIFPNT